MYRKLLTGVLAAAVAALALASATVAGDAPKDKITISAQEGGFSGFVISSRERCQNGRKVTLYKRKPGKRSPRRDKKVGSDIATPNGDGAQWRIEITSPGKYYAYAKKSGCKTLISGVKRG